MDLALVAKWPTSSMIGEHEHRGRSKPSFPRAKSESTVLSALYCISLAMLSKEAKYIFKVKTLRIHFMLLAFCLLFWNSGPFFSLIILGKCHDMHQQRPEYTFRGKKNTIEKGDTYNTELELQLIDLSVCIRRFDFSSIFL